MKTKRLILIAAIGATSLSYSFDAAGAAGRVIRPELFSLGQVFQIAPGKQQFEATLVPPSKKPIALKAGTSIQLNIAPGNADAIRNLRKGDIDALVVAGAVSRSALETLPALDLESLILSQTDIKDADLVPVGRMTRLKVLSLDHCLVSDRGLANFKNLAALEVLNLSDTEITDAGMEALRSLKKLHSLELKRCDVGKNPNWLASLPALNSLNMSSTLLNAETMRTVVKLPKLELFWGTHTKLDDDAFKSLPAMNKLAVVHLSNTTCADGTCQYLSGCKNLLSIDLDRAQATDAGIIKLATLPKLRTLLLSQNQAVTARSLKQITRSPTIKSLDLSFTRLSAAEATGALAGSQLELLRLDGIQMNDAAIQKLTSMKRLRGLSLKRCGLTDAQAQSLLQNLTRLERFQLDENPKVTKAEPFLKRAPHMKQLELNETGISKEQITRIMDAIQPAPLPPQPF